jgi:biotin carboxylase
MSRRLLVCGFGAGMDRSLCSIRELGVELVVATSSVTEYVRRAAWRIVEADPSDTAAVVGALERAGLDRMDGVLSLGFDNPPTVARLCRRFGCSGLSEESARDCTSKERRLARLAAHGLLTPRHAVAHDPAQAVAAVRAIGLPAIVKPVDLTSSIGVTKVESLTAVVASATLALGLSRSGTIVVEEYLHGTEHTVAGFSINGEVHFTGFSDRAYSRKDEFAPFIFEEGDTLPSILDEPMRRRVEREVERGVRALDLDPAFFNTDILVTAVGDVYLIEITGRLTGARIATEVVPLATGVDPLPNAVRLALGEPLELAELSPRRAQAVVQRYLPATGGRVEWVGDIDAVERAAGVYDLFWGMDLAAGMKLPHYRSGDDVIAGVIVAAPTVAFAERIAADALGRLPLRVVPALC